MNKIRLITPAKIARRHSSILAAFVFPFLLTLTAAGYAASADGSNEISLSQEQIRTLGVTLGKLAPVQQIPVLYAPAKVVVPSDHDFLVSASQPGLITRLNASIGDKVKKGAVLAQLNSPDLLSLQRLYLKAESELRLSSLTYNRDKKLLDEGVIAERRWQETSSQHQAFNSEAREHRQLLKIAGMADSEIERLKNTYQLSGLLNVYSPISGTVIERMATAGSRVDILAPLYRIANLDVLWLEINIPQERVADVKIGDRVLIEPQSRNESSGSAVTARISLLGANVNPENQTVMARAVIDGKPTSIRPGQRINIQIIHTTEEPAFRIPNEAVTQNSGQSFIFIRTPNGFLIRPVTIIGKEGDDSIISGDVGGDEEIAVKGAVALKANWLGLGSDE